MNEVYIYTIVALVALGAVAAVILYFVSQKFKVYEDPRIDSTEALLPGANCGGCGFPGCRGFATALVVNDDISSLFCPAGGAETMTAVAEHLGKAAAERAPQVAVLKCAGSCGVRAKTTVYDGASSCTIVAGLYGGDSGCSWGCLGMGDCVEVCGFGAMRIEDGLVVVDQDKCTGCESCVKKCPKRVLELRPKGVKDRRIYVQCSSKDKGGVAKKACGVACIGCMKCVKACGFEAITVENSLAYIDPTKCKLCRKCAGECPTGAITERNFPPKKVVAPKAETATAPAKETAPQTAETESKTEKIEA